MGSVACLRRFPLWLTLLALLALGRAEAAGAPAANQNGGTFRHGPYSAGRCDVCHVAHDAARPHGLAAPERELCFFCHRDLQDQMAVGVRHQVVREQPCSTCHDPHESAYPALLKQPQGVLCTKCHPKIAQQMTRNSVHRPVAEGKCTACHEAHNSPYRQLLKAPFDSRFYAPFTSRRFALCFKCHPEALVVASETKDATNFRNGRKSDHYFHVNDPNKGRSCWVCHEAHGSEQPHLIRRRVTFGQWELPIVFTETPTGGGCLCGCHRRLDYRRD